MKARSFLLFVATVLALAACASQSAYRQWVGQSEVIVGKGGTRIPVDGMDIWDAGDPPRKYKLIGYFDSPGEGRRLGGIIGGIRDLIRDENSDAVKMAREAGGDALIVLRRTTKDQGYVSSGSSTGNVVGTQVNIDSTTRTERVTSTITRFGVIKFVE